jgi:hypothetical protein
MPIYLASLRSSAFTLPAMTQPTPVQSSLHSLTPTAAIIPIGAFSPPLNNVPPLQVWLLCGQAHYPCPTTKTPRHPHRLEALKASPLGGFSDPQLTENYTKHPLPASSHEWIMRKPAIALLPTAPSTSPSLTAQNPHAPHPPPLSPSPSPSPRSTLPSPIRSAAL